MLKDFFLYIKYKLSKLTFTFKKDVDGRLKESFGKVKAESFNFKLIEKYFKNKDNSKAFHILSDNTCNDLDFDEFFMFLDRTHSKVGQQFLYNHLRTINLDQDQTRLNEEIIIELTNDTKQRIFIQKQLEKLDSKEAYYITTLFQQEHISEPKWFVFVKLLSLSSLVFLVLAIYKPLFFVPFILVLCVNIVIHYWNKKNLFQYVSSIPQLLKLNKIASILIDQPKLRQNYSELSASIKLIDGLRKRMSFFKLEAKLQGEFEMVGWFVFEILKILFLLEPLLLFNVLKRINAKTKEIEDVFKFVGHIDMLISVASVRNSLDIYCIPKICADKKIKAENIYHPLIFNCVPNDIEVLDKSILLTGSNMSGKTSFIRAIGLNAITALTINTAFAKKLTIPVVKVCSAIRINDDLMNDKSYYFEEVLRIKEMISESKNGIINLFLLDEIFKGTNTVERISAGKAVLSALKTPNNIVLVSTHDIELTDMLSNEYDLYHFSETVSEKTVGFDYKLKLGKLKNRNAIRILEINDYPKDIIKEAFAISKELEKKDLDPEG